MTAALALVLALVAPASAQTQPAARLAQATSSSLARYVPKDDLIFFLEFDGLDLHSAAWQKTATYKILTETKMGALLEDITTQLVEKAIAGIPPVPDKPTAPQTVAALKYLLGKGFVVGVYGKMPGIPSGVIVIRGAESVEGKKTIGFLRRLMETAPNKAQEARKGRKIAVVEGGAWWTEKEDLVVAFPPIENVDAVLDTLDGKIESVLKLPLRDDLAKVEDGFTPVLRAFVNIKALPALPPQIGALGFADVQRVDLRWGIQDDAIVTSLRVIAPPPRKGILGFLDGPTFTVQTLPPIPADAKDFLAVSLDLDATFTKFVEVSSMTNPQAGAQIEAMKQNLLAATGVKLSEDVLKHVGPKFSIFGKMTGDKVAVTPGMSWTMPEFSLVAESDNAAELGKSIDLLMAQPIQRLKTAPDPSKGPKIQQLASPEKGYDITLPANADNPMAAILKPALRYGKTQISAGTTPAAAKAALALDNKSTGWTPAADFAPMTKRMPKGMVFLAVSDPRETLPQAIAALPALVPILNAATMNRPPGAAPGPFLKIDSSMIPPADEMTKRLSPGFLALSVDNLGWSLTMRDSFPSFTSPTTSGVAVALLLPAVQAAREAARRSKCVNNLSQIGLGLHNYHNANNHFPTGVFDKKGKALLSWRVQILPYLEQQKLYDEFKLDEPWDSAHNKPLIDKMPAVFACPTRMNPKPGMTQYRGFNGEKGFFEDPDGTTIASMTDGTSNTIAVGEFKEAVIWTKPDDAKTDDPGAFFGSEHPGGFNVLLGDGAVRFLKYSIDKVILKALVTRNGGEVINNDF